MRFLHAADIHLGYEQYGETERYNDFARAFLSMIDDALARRVDFALLAGDLFNKRSIEPRTLLWAVRGLEQLREAGVPVFAVEGNHERSNYLEAFSWLDYLVEMGLLILLNPIIRDGKMALAPWDAEARIGAYYDLPGGVRVMGVKYYGGSTPRVVQDLTAALADLPGPRPAYTILMMHAGLQGILDQYSATLSRAQLDPLRPYVDYLALGHIHKPFEQDDWLYNPGSLETNAVNEAAWEDRGYLIVDIAPGGAPPHRVTHVRRARREFVRLSFGVDAYESPSHLHEAIAAYLRREATPERAAAKAVVELQLTGVLAFDQAELDIPGIEQLIQESFTPLVARVKNSTAATEYEIAAEEELSRVERERYVLRELVERDARRRDASDRWAQMAQQLKQMALARSAPGDIIAELRAFRASLAEEGNAC